MMKQRMHALKNALNNVLIMLLGTALVFTLIMIIQTSYAADRQMNNMYDKLKNAEMRLEQNRQEAQENWTTFHEAMDSKLRTAALLLDRMDTVSEDVLDSLESSASFDFLGVYRNVGNHVAGKHCATVEIRERLFGGENCVVQDKGERYIAWFCAPLSDGDCVLGGKVCTEYALTQQTMSSFAYSLDELDLQSDAHVLLVDNETGKLIYASDALSESAFKMGRTSRSFVVIDDVRYAYAVYEGENYTFVSLVPQSSVSESVRNIAVLLSVIFAIIIGLVSTYAFFIEEEFESDSADSAKKDKNEKTKKFFGTPVDATLYYKARNVVLLALVSVFVICTYMQMLSAVGRQHLASVNGLNGLDMLLQENDKRIQNLSDQYAADYSARANEIAQILKHDAGMLRREEIIRLAETQGVDVLYVFDEQGRTVVTNDVYQDFVLSDNPEDQSHAFWPVIKGYTETYVQELRADNSGTNRMMQYIGVRRQDAPGMVQVGMNPEIITRRLARTQMREVLDTVIVENGGMVFAVDSTTGSLLYWPDAREIGRNASNVGLSTSAMTDGFSGWQRLGGREYYVSSLLHGDILLLTAVPRENIYAHVLTIAAIVTLNCAVLTCVVLYLLLRSSMSFRKGFATVEGVQPAPNAFFTIFRNDRRQTTQNAASRWNGTVLHFSGMNPEQKLKKVLSVLASILTVILFVLYQLSQSRTINPILSLILSRRWERSLNIFALSYVLITTMEILMASLAVRAIIGWFSMGANTRSETVGRMMQNFIRYFAIIGAVLYGIQFFGVDSTTIITGTGIITLGVSLGSQSLVADIMAGIFIVFEGEFRVGDIITIGDFRGTVEEIGIRTTKVNKKGNIKIFRNSQISGVLNMTKEDSVAVCEFQVSYGTNLKKLEKILEREFPKISKNIPDLNGDLKYKGVSALGDSGVTLLVIGICEESTRPDVERAMNREMKLLMDKHGIEIPFPQVVVHTPVELPEEIPEIPEEKIVSEQ